ncbi:MAG: aminotransferase class I/II-fold pyridoxal phosphate-dependent enzyme [Lachnospiraceae bacterium]|nr:aminotransferase class I/II-fold pyridoxal phosphate-dependent enzyme [Lachnospiraceae bacterium]
MKFSKRVSQSEESIFTFLLNKKREKEAAGLSVIDLSVGTPNIPPTEEVRRVIAEEAMKPESYIYAIRDLEELQEAVAAWYRRRYDVVLDPASQIVALLGSQEGLAHIALSIADPGDVILVPDPCYPVFRDGPAIAGAEVHYMPMKPENDFLIDFDAIPEAIADRAVLMIVSYPNNPTTALAPAWWYEKLIAFARRHDIIVLHDNAYSELVFDTEPTPSFLSYPGAFEVGVEFNSLSKTYGMAGARVGFCVGCEAVVSKLKQLKSNMDYGIFLPVQKAAVRAITGDQTCVAATREAYKRRREILADSFTAAGWPVGKCAATMFIWARIPGPYTDSRTFVLDLLDRAGILVTPGSAFGPSGEGYVRMALVQDDEVIREAAERLKASGILG